MAILNEPVIATTGSENAVEGRSESGRGVVGSSDRHYGVRGHSRVQLASVGSLAQRVASLEATVADLQRSVSYLLTVAHFH